MTDQEANEAVAMKLGWKIVRERGCATQVYRPDGTFAGLAYKCKFQPASSNPIPDYCSDLNAMYQAEEQMNWGQWVNYMGHLNQIISREPEGIGRHLWHSTARQRAEAFLRTFNLWKE